MTETDSWQHSQLVLRAGESVAVVSEEQQGKTAIQRPAWC